MKKQQAEKKETETNPTAEPSTAKHKPLEDKVLAVMKTLRENSVPTTSTLLRDKLALDKESGRDQIRRLMKRLAKDGKVAITEKKVGERKQCVYTPKR
jgi:hypothetical protein